MLGTSDEVADLRILEPGTHVLPASARTALPAVPSPSLSAEGAAGPMRARVHAFSTLQGPFRTAFICGALKGGKSKVLSLNDE